MVAGTGAAALLTGCGGGLFTKEPTSTPTRVPEPTSLPDPTMTPTTELPPTATATIEPTPTEVPATPTATATGTIDIPPYTPVERVAPETVFPERYNAEHAMLHEFEGTGEYEGIELPIYTAVAEIPGIETLEFNQAFIDFLGKGFIFACYGRYKEVMGNDVTFEDYLDLVRQGRGQITYHNLDERASTIDPRDGVAILVTGSEDLPLRVNPLVSPPNRADLRLTDKKQPLIVYEANQEMFESNVAVGVANGRTKSFAMASEIASNFINSLDYYAHVDGPKIDYGGNYTNIHSSMVSSKLTALSVEAAKNLGVDEHGVTYHHRIFVERDKRYNDKYLIVVNGGS